MSVDSLHVLPFLADMQINPGTLFCKALILPQSASIYSALDCHCQSLLTLKMK